MRWEMKPNLKWAPTVVLDQDFNKSYAAAKAHLQETQAEYHS